MRYTFRFTKGNTSSCNTPKKLNTISSSNTVDAHQTAVQKNEKHTTTKIVATTTSTNIQKTPIQTKSKRRNNRRRENRSKSRNRGNASRENLDDGNGGGGEGKNLSRDLFPSIEKKACGVTEATIINGNNNKSIYSNTNDIANKERNNYDELVKVEDVKFNDSSFCKRMNNTSSYGIDGDCSGNNFSSKGLDIRCSTPLRSFGINNTSFKSSIFESPSNDNSPIHHRRIGNMNITNNSENERTKSSICLGDYLFSNSCGSSNLKQQNKSQRTNLRSSLSRGENNSHNGMESDSKPRRRVVPTAVSTSRSSIQIEFNTSSFKEDNNLLNIMPEECEPNRNGLMKDRVDLLREKQNIIKNFLEENQNENAIKIIPNKLEIQLVTPPKNNNFKIDLTQASSTCYLDALIQVHSFIIETNLTINILSEISFLLKLINIGNDGLIISKPPPPQKGLNEQLSVGVNLTSDSNKLQKFKHNLLLKTIPNCIYFALGVLSLQKNLLSLLDTTTIKVLLDSERLPSLNPPLYEFLRTILTTKLNLVSKYLSGSRVEAQIGNSVFYQEEHDTKQYYPSEKEFRIFKTQRDLFYSLLHQWEHQYLTSKPDKILQLDRKVHELITTLDHPINMTHLAKLFVAQLIISCNYDSAIPEFLSGIDPKKLSKLQQRLVAPSNYSTEYVFPGVQSFYRDFIVAAQFSVNFSEQLKVALIYELVNMDRESCVDEDFECSVSVFIIFE